MNIKLKNIDIYTISGLLAKNAPKNRHDTHRLRRDVYINEFKRIGVWDNVHETPAIYQSLPNCRQFGLTVAHAKIWEDIIINRKEVSMITEDDVLFHDNILELWPEYCNFISKDFLYVNVGGSLHAAGKEPIVIEKLVHGEPTWCTHAYLISYEGAMQLLHHYYSIINMPIFHSLDYRELKIDIMWKRWYDRLSRENKERVYSFSSTSDIPAVWNKFTWFKQSDNLNHQVHRVREGKPPLKFCQSVGLAYQFRTTGKRLENNIDFFLRK